MSCDLNYDLGFTKGGDILTKLIDSPLPTKYVLVEKEPELQPTPQPKPQSKPKQTAKPAPSFCITLDPETKQYTISTAQPKKSPERILPTTVVQPTTLQIIPVDQAAEAAAEAAPAQLVPVQAAKPVPAQPVPAQPAQPVPVQPVPAQPVPAQPVPAQPVPAQPVPAQPTQAAQPAQPVPAQPVPAQPTQAAQPAQPVPVAQPVPASTQPTQPVPVPVPTQPAQPAKSAQAAQTVPGPTLAVQPVPGPIQPGSPVIQPMQTLVPSQVPKPDLPALPSLVSNQPKPIAQMFGTLQPTASLQPSLVATSFPTAPSYSKALQQGGWQFDAVQNQWKYAPGQPGQPGQPGLPQFPAQAFGAPAAKAFDYTAAQEALNLVKMKLPQATLEPKKGNLRPKQPPQRNIPVPEPTLQQIPKLSAQTAADFRIPRPGTSSQAPSQTPSQAPSQAPIQMPSQPLPSPTIPSPTLDSEALFYRNQLLPAINTSIESIEKKLAQLSQPLI